MSASKKIQEKALSESNPTYKLVFMDCDMPILDGINVERKLLLN